MIDITLGCLAQYRILFSQERSFHSFCLLIFCFMGRLHTPCLSGLISEFGLAGCFYHRFLRLIETLSAAPEELEKIHVERTVEQLKPKAGLFIIVDSTLNPKEGRRMPGVSSLCQTSSSNSKKEFVTGHDIENVALLLGKGDESFAVPLMSYIRNGAIHSNRSSRTCLDVLCKELAKYHCLRGATTVADCYYSSGLHARVLKDELDISLISRVKSNAVAFLRPINKKKRSRGRPRKFGKKVVLRHLGTSRVPDFEFKSKSNGAIHSYECWEERLLWKSYDGYVRFIRVRRDDKHEIVLISTSESLSVEQIVCLYACRWRIEEHFKDQKQHMEFGGYRFWSKSCPKVRKGHKLHTHRMKPEQRESIRKKERQYLTHLILTNIATSSLHTIRQQQSNKVWKSFPGWLRSIRPGILPSIRVCKEAFKYELIKFLWSSNDSKDLPKYVRASHTNESKSALEEFKRLAS